METQSEWAEPLRILMLEDVPTDAELTLRELRKEGIPFVSQRVETREQFERALTEFKPELILSDFSLPTAFDGLTALDIARRALPDVPYIFVSGTIGEDRAVEALKRGATDYVLKDRLNRLVPVIKRALEEARERAARRRAEEDLERTRSRLNSIVGSLRDVVWSYSVRENRMLYVSPAIEEIWGRPMADFYADRDAWLAGIHPRDRERVEEAWRLAPEQGQFECAYRLIQPGGQTRWIRDRGRAVPGADGAPDRIDGLAHDITELKRHEERIARLSRIHALLSGINSTIVRVRSEDELFREACRIAVEQGGFRLAWIGVLDKQTLAIVSQVWAGEECGLLSVMRMSAREDLPEGRGVTGLALRSREPIVVNDVVGDERLRYKHEVLERGFRALIVLPLLVGNEVFGVLELYAAEAGMFDQEEMGLLRELAGDISFAVDHIAKAERLDYLAYYDALTGLPSRPLFYERVAQQIQDFEGSRDSIAIAALNIERFRNINETLGIQAGDGILKSLAQRLAAAFSDAGTTARINADCFAVAFGGAHDETAIAHVIEQRVFAVLNEPFIVQGRTLRIAMNAGIAVHPDDGNDAAMLFLNAEAALKQAKESGQRFLFYTPQMNARVAEQLRLENDLREAVLAEQFILHYQPRVELASRTISGLEALIRWAHPERGLVPPGEFIPLLEETGLILEVGRYALRRAALDHAAWRAAGLKPPRIAVNVSQIQLRRRDFVEDVKSALDEAGGRYESIDVEITESMLMEDLQGTMDKLAELQAMAIGIALDDFGTGYSSLSYLAKLPINSLKIDRSFISTMAQSPEHMAIVSTVISLGHALNLKMVAEGVETEEQRNLLRLLKCDEIQGYLFSPPLPSDRIVALLK